MKLDLSLFKELFGTAFKDFESKGYFAEAFGGECEDGGPFAGNLGYDIDGFFFRRTRKKNLWPVADNLSRYSEEDLFDVIELLYDLVSKPNHSSSHGWHSACTHYADFDPVVGRAHFLEEVNSFLHDYGAGYELNTKGEIISRHRGYETLLDAKMPATDPSAVEARVELAVEKFRSRHASPDDRRSAVRELVDVLEYLRPQLKKVLPKGDENDLFNIANNFGFRHNNKLQKTDYDSDIWHRWLFYYYLSTIHAVTRLIARAEKKDKSHA